MTETANQEATVQPWSSIEGWIWCGTAGHFIGARNCHLHLNTRVGNYRISTIGMYRPPYSPDQDKEVGWGRTAETFVFRVEGFGEHGEGEISDWSEIDSEGYSDPIAAERGHMRMCLKYDRIARIETDGRD